MNRLSLKAGNCLTESGSGCTFERASCGTEDTIVSWRSAGEMRGAPYTAHGGYCLLAKSVREMTLGRCGGKGGDGGMCAPNAASCNVAGAFVEAYSCVMEETTFGRCGADRCSWSPADCRAGEAWTFPAAECSYDRVRVGGCDEGDGAVYCAVSADGCGAGEAYLDPLEVASQMDTECYVGMQAVVPMEDQPLFNEALAETSTGSTTNGGGEWEVPAIIGAAVGGALAVAVLGYGALSLHRKKKKAVARKEQVVFQTTDFENPKSP